MDSSRGRIFRCATSIVGCIGAIAALALPAPAGAQPLDEPDFFVRLVVDPGTVVEACGGLPQECLYRPLSGTLVVLHEPGGVIGESDLRLGEDRFPGPNDLQLTELEGTSIVDPFGVQVGIVFTGSRDLEVGAPQTADLRFDIGGDFWVLNGLYDTGGILDPVLNLRQNEIRFGNVVLHPIATDPADDTPRLRLAFGRFVVQAEWADGTGRRGFATPAPLADDGAYFWFFRQGNPELLVKLLDACSPFGHYWFFVAGVTNLETTITVTEIPTGQEKIYGNPLGRPFQPILDTQAFGCE